jgi:cytochrome c-type biogenesis protein CcmE
MADIDLTPRRDPSDSDIHRAPTKKKRNIGPMLLLGLAIVAGGVIVTQFLGSAVDYFCNVDEVGQRDGCEEGRRIRLQGTVDAGTVVTSAGLTTFSISYGEQRMDVEYDGEPGGIFKECIPVVVHGEIRNGVLYGDNLDVKHSDEYVEASAENIAKAEAESVSECPASVDA